MGSLSWKVLRVGIPVAELVVQLAPGFDPVSSIKKAHALS